MVYATSRAAGHVKFIHCSSNWGTLLRKLHARLGMLKKLASVYDQYVCSSKARCMQRCNTIYSTVFPVLFTHILYLWILTKHRKLLSLSHNMQPCCPWTFQFCLGKFNGLIFCFLYGCLIRWEWGIHVLIWVMTHLFDLQFCLPSPKKSYWLVLPNKKKKESSTCTVVEV